MEPLERDAKGLGVGYWLAVGWLAAVAFAAVFAAQLPLADPLAPDFTALSAPPSTAHWLGTDELGRDTLSRLVFGARVTLIVGLASVAVAMVLGTAIGLAAGFYRHWLDRTMSWLVNVLLAFPALILALVLAAFLGPDLKNVIIAVAVIAIPGFARLSRAVTIQTAEREFVIAARSLGARSGRLIVREILPSVMSPVLTFAITVVGFVIIVEGALSFLGLGVPLPLPTWGGMISEGKDMLAESPVQVLAPSLSLLATIVSLNVIADRLETRLGLLEVRT